MRRLTKYAVRIFIPALVAGILVWSPVKAATYEYAATARGNYGVARFRFWQPDNAAFIKGVAVLVPGSDNDGRPLADDPVWQSFAGRHDFALLACYYTAAGEPSYCMADVGSGSALLAALQHFSKKGHHPEVASDPLILWGYSAGGQFNYEFACWKPGRLIAFIVNKGCVYYTDNPPPTALGVPAIFFIGERDLEFRVSETTRAFKAGRSRGALWALAMEPGASHEIGGTADLARSFFDTIIPMRLRWEKGNWRLIDLKESSGWAGNLKTHEISLQSRSGKGLNAWLPNKTMAERWQKFVTPKKSILRAVPWAAAGMAIVFGWIWYRARRKPAAS